MFYVYILENDTTHQYYTGSTDDLTRRLDEHASGKSRFTRHKGPWKLVYSKGFETRSQAVRREMEIKNKKNRKYIQDTVKRQGRLND